MGFGVSGASALIFLGVLIAGVTAYTASHAAVEQVSEAREDDRERLLDRRNTAINVTNATLETGTLTLAVENTGSTTLAVNDTTVLVDNAYQETDAGNGTNVDGVSVIDTDVWAPGETLRLNTTTFSSAGRVRVVTGTGVADDRAVTGA
jgi:flagellar protein FlaF